MAAILEHIRGIWACHKSDAFDKDYRKKIIVAEQEGNLDLADALKSEEGMRNVNVFQVAQRHRSAQRVKQAKRLDISLDDIPKPQGEWSHWDQDPRGLPGVLHWHSYHLLESAIAKAEKGRAVERREKLKTYAPYVAVLMTLLVGIIAAVAER